MHTNILIFGDSIAQGFFDNVGGGWANCLATYFNDQAVKSNFSVENLVFNLGISGDTIVGVSERFEPEINSRVGEGEKCVIIFAIGINDSQVYIATGENKTSISEYEKILKSLGNLAQNREYSTVFIGLAPVDESRVSPLPWGPSGRAYRNSGVKKFDAAVEKVAHEMNSLFIPMQDVFGDNPSKYLGDGLHPDAEGHRMMFERVRGYLEREKIV